MGWPVFPCATRGKRPLTPNGCRDGTTDPATIRRWWRSWPNANIGLLCGAQGGVSVVDVDIEVDEASGELTEDGWQSWEALEAEHGEAPTTLCSLTPGGGGHFVFKADPPPANKNDWREGIDIRGDGYYIVLPPSIHPNGNAYQWMEGRSPSDMQPAPLPDWLRPEREATPPRQAKLLTMPLPDLGGDAKLRRASAYLAEMDPAIMGAGGHDRLYAAATAMVHGFDLPPDVARSLLLAEYNPRCVPPWDMATPRDAKDFNRKIEQAATRPHDQPRGWLLAEGDDGGGVAHGAAVAARLVASKSRKSAQNIPNSITEPTSEPIKQATPSPSADLPGWLLQPPGYVGELTSWINATAFKPQPILALANALAFFGAVVGRKVADSADLRTNLYCLGVGESGCGKDHSRKQIKRLCAAAGLTDKLLGGEDVTSDVAIVKAAQANPSLLFQFDEIGHMIASAHSRNAATYQRAIPVTLTKLYSSSNTVYLGKEYAGEAERQDIDQPNVCVYGTTVPSRLYEGITPAEIRDGFMGRMLVFQTLDDDPEPTDAPTAQPSQSLVQMAQAWYQRRIEPPKGTGSIDAALRPWQITVHATDAAQRRFLDLRQRGRSQRKAIARQAPGLDSLWSRAEENARKVALTLAAGCDFTEPVIDEPIASYACELVAELVDRLVEQIRDHVTDSEVGRQINAVKAAVRASGGRATKYQITRLTQHKMRARERNEVIQTLVESGDMVAETLPAGSAGGRPATVFRLV